MSISASVKPWNTVRIARSTRWMFYAIGIGVWITGALWLLFHHFLARQGEFGPSPNPLEPWWLRLHGAFAFGTIWIFGLLWSAHVRAAWPYRRRRVSGSALVAFFVWLSVSGYLLYYLGEEILRSAVSLTHWVAGLAAPAGFAWHRWRKTRSRSRL